MEQPRIPIEFYAGETFAPLPFLWLDQNGIPLDITNFTATLSARQTVNAGDPPVILATVANAMISINGPAGSIQVILPASYTSGLPAPFEGFYDLWVYSPGGIATRLFGGPICIKQPVTRA